MCGKGKETQKGDDTGCQAYFGKTTGDQDNGTDTWGTICIQNSGCFGPMSYSLVVAGKRKGGGGTNLLHRCGECNEVHSRGCMKKHYPAKHSGTWLPHPSPKPALD